MCSSHFISGKPGSLFDETNPDWLPTINMGYGPMVESKQSNFERYQRQKRRMKRIREDESVGIKCKSPKQQVASDNEHVGESITEPDLAAAEESVIGHCDEDEVYYKEVHCQTDSTVIIQSEHDNTAMHEMIAKTKKDNIMLRSEVLMLKSDLCSQALTQEALRDNPQKLKVYTGIVDWTVLMALLNLVNPCLSSTGASKLSAFT